MATFNIFADRGCRVFDFPAKMKNNETGDTFIVSSVSEMRPCFPLAHAIWEIQTKEPDHFFVVVGDMPTVTVISMAADFDGTPIEIIAADVLGGTPQNDQFVAALGAINIMAAGITTAATQ